VNKETGKTTALNLLLLCASIVFTLVVLEFALRVYHGGAFEFVSLLDGPPGRTVYHQRLGWAPNPGRFGKDWVSTVDDSGFRSNGNQECNDDKRVLAVGDSFTFGSEVEDSETWPANLERALGSCVFNAGVGAYGVDQAFLRAEALLDSLKPDLIVLAFISDDINRTEFSVYPWGRGPKPYFVLENGLLVLRNVPVPELGKTNPSFLDNARQVLSYSHLANEIFRRAVPEWWYNRPKDIEQVHNDGVAVSTELIARLNDLARSQGAQLIAVTLATSGHIGDNARLPAVVEALSVRGVRVLDLASETVKLPESDRQALYRPKGHYTPATNKWIANEIAARLREDAILP